VGWGCFDDQSPEEVEPRKENYYHKLAYVLCSQETVRESPNLG